jgi:hygromycin-B 7''-O-kinase
VNKQSQAGLLPAVANAEAFRAWRADRSQWLPVVAGIARDHALPCGTIEAFSTGTNLVVALDGRLILKLFPPMFRSQFVSEHTSLSLLDGRLSLPIPKIVCMGEREQWPYLVITRLDGLLGTQAWPLLPEDQKENLLGQIGETIAEVQRVPIGDLAHLEPNWQQFIAGQIEGCRARHQRLGLPPKYLAGLDELLRQAPDLIPLHTPPVILIGEYIPENILLSCHSGDWKLAGLFDFGDVMTGWGEYDLLGPSAFMTAGRPRRVRSLLRGFGVREADLDETLTRRLLILMLLHRASDPVRHICIEGWQDKADNLVDLERLLWPLSADYH